MCYTKVVVKKAEEAITMKVNGKEIKRNHRWNYSEIKYLEARIVSLISGLDKKGYDVSFDKSRMSEAIYVTINGNKVSFRNHDYFSGNLNEHTVWLDQFKTWTEAKNHFNTKIIPTINGEEVEEQKKKAPTQKELIAEANQRLEKETDPTIQMVLESRIKRLQNA